MTTIEKTIGPVNDTSLVSLDGFRHTTSQLAQSAAEHAANAGHARVVVARIHAAEMREGMSQDQDDHWVRVAGHHWVVLVDKVSQENRRAILRAEIDRRHADKQQEAEALFNELLEAYKSAPHKFIMTGSQFADDMKKAGFSELVSAAYKSQKLEVLRSLVFNRNTGRI